jgi:hypothetical protein
VKQILTMMELSHSLTLNEDALNQIPEAKRPVFVFEWLRFLDKVLIAAQKVKILNKNIFNILLRKNLLKIARYSR